MTPVEPTSVASLPRLLVAVATYQRPDSLAELIPELLHHLDIVTVAELAKARLLVVDNDPGGSARPAVDAVSDARVGYVREDEPGIASARNRALDEAGQDRLLVFIDDDERPGEQWLAALVRTWRDTEAAAVTGLVIADYLAPPSRAIVAGAFFERPSAPSGTPRNGAPTGNLLLDLDQVRKLGLRFDPRYGTTGGEDAKFARQLLDRGGRIVWCAESVVTDQVPVERMTRSWLRQRGIRQGNTQGRIALDLRGGRPAVLVRSRLALHGAALVAKGMARRMLGHVRTDVARQATGAWLTWRGQGVLLSTLGHEIEEYRRASG